jgi:glycosyltransferase involved in cell wall biosynthesis
MPSDWTGRAVFLVQRIGPYHHARLQAAAALLPGAITAVEFRPGDRVYAWSPVEPVGNYPRVSLASRSGLIPCLAELHPDAVVCVGYADPEIHEAAAWAMARNVPIVTCSDSTRIDEIRTPLREALKRRIVTAFDAALVAGERADAYLGNLGLPSRCRFRPWDVVDNGHFQQGADAARSAPRPARARLGLPDRYFLCVARFVAKKNLTGLVDAYARYAAAAGAAAWSLVLSGAGPLEAELRAQVSAAGLSERVHFPGFVQYPDLPALYGLSEALVLPSASDQWGLVANEAMAAGLPVLVSVRCGCAPDLVRDGENGFVFDPFDPTGMASRLGQMAGLAVDRRRAMGLRSREIIAAYSPEAFARGLRAALACATFGPRRGPRRLRGAMLRLLALRSVENLSG